ncbi:hypothetical protein BDD12DRAFT_641656, partial [Trichophaea hybrida]
TLEGMPIEVLWNIFEGLDLESLTSLRRVTTFIRSIVSSIPLYAKIIDSVPHIVRTYLSTSSASSITLYDIRDALHSTRCFGCGNFGLRLWLPRCVRVCGKC